MTQHFPIPDSWKDRVVATRDNRPNGGTIAQITFDITPGPDDVSRTYSIPIPLTVVNGLPKRRLMKIQIGSFDPEDKVSTHTWISFEEWWGHKPTPAFIERIIEGYRHYNSHARWGIKIWEE